MSNVQITIGLGWKARLDAAPELVGLEVFANNLANKIGRSDGNRLSRHGIWLGCIHKWQAESVTTIIRWLLFWRQRSQSAKIQAQTIWKTQTSVIEVELYWRVFF